MQALKTPTVPALARGFAILERVARSNNGLTFSQLTREFHFPKSSLHSLLVTFERMGYLERLAASGRYVAGLNLIHLANVASRGLVLRQKAGPLLCDLTQRLKLTAHLAILDDQEPLLVAKVEPSGGLPVATWVGKRVDYHCTSLGKALIAWMEPEAISKLIRERRMLRHNENTICTPKRLQEELSRTRRTGYAIDDEEEEIGIRCVGVPVFGEDAVVEAAVSVSGTTQEMPLDLVPELANILKQAASDMSRRLRI